MEISFRGIIESLVGTIKKAGSILFTNEQNLYLVDSNGEKIKITDVIFNYTERELKFLEHPLTNKIYVSKDKGQLYMWTGTKWKLLSGMGSGSIFAGYERERVICEDNQKIIRVPFLFPSGGRLKVFKNGVLQELNIHYKENVDKVELVTPANYNDEYIFILDPLKGEKNKYERRTIPAIEGQYSYIIPFDFPIGGQLKVFKNGILQALDKDYYENNHEIIFQHETLSTDLIVVILDPIDEEIEKPKINPMLLDLEYNLEIEENKEGLPIKEKFTYSDGEIKTIDYEYDDLNRITRKIVTIRDDIRVATFSYKENGNLKSISNVLIKEEE